MAGKETRKESDRGEASAQHWHNVKSRDHVENSLGGNSPAEGCLGGMLCAISSGEDPNVVWMGEEMEVV